MTMTLIERLHELGFSGNELGHEAADEIKRLTEQLDRIGRIDNSIAAQLGRSMEHNARVKVELQQWAKAYPLTAFPEPDMAKAAELLKAGGQTLDAVSASNMRHVLKRVLEILEDQPSKNSG